MEQELERRVFVSHMLRSIAVCLLVACGPRTLGPSNATGRAPSPEGEPAEDGRVEDSPAGDSLSEAPSERASTRGEVPPSETDLAAAVAARLRALENALSDVQPASVPGMQAYLSACVASEAQLAAITRFEADEPAFPGDQDAVFAYAESCTIGSALARDRNGNWLAFVVDVEESGAPASLVLHRGDDANEDVLVRLGEGLHPAEFAALQLRARRGRWGTSENLIRAQSTEDFSLNTFAPLVELGGHEAVDGMRLLAHTVNDLDQPEYVLVAQRPGQAPTELARRPGFLGACDAAGCEDQDRCHDELREQGRLCVLPLGIDTVSVHGDEIAVLATIQVAGHGGYPSTHFFARLPGSPLSER